MKPPISATKLTPRAMACCHASVAPINGTLTTRTSTWARAKGARAHLRRPNYPNDTSNIAAPNMAKINTSRVTPEILETCDGPVSPSREIPITTRQAYTR